MQLISNAALTLSSYLTVSVLQPPSWGKPAVFKKNSDTRRAPYLQETMTDSLQHQRFNLLSVWCKSFRDTSRGISKLQSLQPEVQIQIHEWFHMCSTEIHSSDRVQLNTHTLTHSHNRTHTETRSSNWFQLSFYILHETLKSLHNRRLKGNYNIMKDMWAVPSTKYVSDVFLTLTHNSEKFCLKVGRNIVLSPCSRVIPWICLWPGIKW